MATFPFSKQFDSMDCGPTCLAMVCKYFGRSIPIQLLRERSQINRQGVNMLGISEAAEGVGLRTLSVRLSYRQLCKDASLPAILHWNQNHFVVIYKITRKKLYIADPAQGLIKYGQEQFLSCWASNRANTEKEGFALLVEPTPAFFTINDEAAAEVGSPAPGFKNIFTYLLPYKNFVLQLVIGLVIAGILQLIVPFLTKSVVDAGINTANIHFVYLVLLAQLALITGRLAVDFVRSWLLLHISTRINIAILTDFFIKLMKLPVAFFDSKQTGDILQRINDHQRIESFITGSSVNILFSLINLLVFSTVLYFFNTGIFFVFIGGSILYSGWVLLFLKRRKALDYTRFDIGSKEQSTTIQMIQGMQEIKLSGIEKPIRWKWERLQSKLFRLNMKDLSLSQWQQSGGFFLNETKNTLITFLSAKAVIEGQMTLGAMLAIQYIVGQLNSPIEQMSSFVQGWQNAKLSIDRLNEIHNLEDEEPKERHLFQELSACFKRQVVSGNAPVNHASLSGREPERSIAIRVKPGFANGNGYPEQFGEDQFGISFSREDRDLRFKDVSFAYPGAGNEPVLRNINLIIPNGKITAIVGLSGSGKTTLLKLLLKFYEPQKGEIKFDNISLSNISHRAWRGYCGVVMQESYIFSDTILRNIAPGIETADMERLDQAIGIANIREFVEGLPLGLNSKIGQEGVPISTGQKQRLLIARAVYRDPEFIFFDEATNSLDANNEIVILENLRSFFARKTVVVVAHRLSTVKHADQIVVLNRGMISEKGTHSELVKLKGEYYTLVRNQLEMGE
jgi:ATP-binding cassette subfamily B protein